MKLNVNGSIKDFPESVSLSEVVIKFCQQPKHIVTALNGDVVPAAEREKILLKEGDYIDLIAAVGGG